MTDAVVLIWTTHCDICLTSPPASTFPHSPPTPHSSQRARPCHSQLKNFQGLLTTRRIKAKPSPQPVKPYRIRLCLHLWSLLTPLARAPPLVCAWARACVHVCLSMPSSSLPPRPLHWPVLCLDSSYLCQGSDFPTSSPTYIVTCLFLPAYSSACAAVSHHSLYFCFPDFL